MQHVAIRKWEELKEEFGNECFKCGSTENLEFAHLKPTDLKGEGRGKPNRYYDIKNNPECYGLMCDKCHKEYDKNG